MASFWEDILTKAGPGLFETGLGLYIGNLEKDRAAKQLRKAQGPLFDQSQRLAGQSLTRAEGMDPKTMAAERFAAQQDLLAPGREADLQSLMRRLQKQGMLGAASYAPVPGTVQQPGVAMNPQLAALFAAQEGAKAKSAYDSLGEGEKYLDQLITRGGTLQRSAEQARSAGVNPNVQSLMPSKPSTKETLLRGAGRAIMDPKVRGSVFDLLKQGAGMFGGGSSPVIPAYDYSFDGWDF